MSQASNYLEDQIIAHLYRTSTWSKPTVLAHALFTAAPGEAGGGTEVANSGSYARVTLNPLDANWAATSGGNGQTSNSSAITFSAPTGNWGTVTHLAQIDSVTWGAGNYWVYGTLTNSRIINNGDAAPSFAAGALVISVA